MSTITVKNWKVTEDNSPEFQFIRPEYHVTYWEIPKWWYKGAELCYTSCVRIDVGETSIYVDGTSPLMQFTLEWEQGGEGSAAFTNWRCIDRALFLNKNNLGAVNSGESDEYIDVQFTDYFYKIRWDNYFGPNVNVPLQSDQNPEWVNGNNSRPFYQDPIPFITGTYIGGKEPVTYEYRHKEQIAPNEEWTTPTEFFPQTNTPTEEVIQLDYKSKAQRIHIETKATDDEGAVVYNNGHYLDLTNPVPKITDAPIASAFNQYVIGEQVLGFAGAFTGGLPDATARARWQWRESNSGPWTNDTWSQNVGPEQPVWSSAIPEGMVQVRFQYQVVEPSANSGNGPRNTTKAAGIFDTISSMPLTGSGESTLTGTFQVGEEVYVDQVAQFAGGEKPVVYEYQYQMNDSPTGGGWQGFGGPWTEYTPASRAAPSKTLTAETEGKYIRLNVRATDNLGAQVVQPGKAYGPVAPMASTNWGSVIVYVNDIEYNYFVGAALTVLMNDPIPVKVEWLGDATGTCLWSQRAGGSAVFDDATKTDPIVTLTGEGLTTISFLLSDPTGQADTTRNESITFWAVDAF